MAGAKYIKKISLGMTKKFQRQKQWLVYPSHKLGYKGGQLNLGDSTPQGRSI